MKENESEKCCGGCCWFQHEDADGWGLCPHQNKTVGGPMHCSDLCTTSEFCSVERKRHYMAVLLQHNRWRRDNDVPNSRKAVDVKELGKAIDFAYSYMKTLGNS